MEVNLYINGKDAYKEWGITLVNSSSLSALMTPPSKKERTSNSSKLEDGTRYITSDVKLQKRDVSLALQFSAISEEMFLKRYKSFCEILTSSETIDIYTSYDPDTLYKFLYESCSQFTQYYRGIAKFTLKLTEPDPTDRTNTYTTK